MAKYGRKTFLWNTSVSFKRTLFDDKVFWASIEDDGCSADTPLLTVAWE